MRVMDLEWDALTLQRPDRLLDSKRAIARAEEKRVGVDDFEALQMRRRMVRELRAERHGDSCSRGQRRRAQRETPEQLEHRREVMRQAWQRGVFSGRVQWCRHRTPQKVRKAVALRAEGATWQTIASRFGITQYTAMRWCGWTRKPEPTNRRPITVGGVTYPSQREAARRTGLDRGTIRRLAAREAT